MPARPQGLHQRPPHVLEHESVRAIVGLALAEDIGPGDATTESVVDPAMRAVGRIVAKQTGVLSGLAAVRATIGAIDAAVELEIHADDGSSVAPGREVATLSGSACSLLTLERVALNFLQRLSGIATLTSRYVAALAGTGVVVVDTRKTTPGMRALEKAAVAHGGGGNHRFGLHDAMMIKDNHIVAAGGLRQAVARARQTRPDLYLVVEARTRAEVEEVATLGVEQILLDNMNPEGIREAVEQIRQSESRRSLPPAWIEVSGGITLETIREKALPGVDLISVGALTHSARALDLSLELELAVEGGRKAGQHL